LFNAAPICLSAAMREPPQHVADDTRDQDSHKWLLLHTSADARDNVLRLASNLTSLAFGLRSGVARQSTNGVLHFSGNILEGVFNTIFTLCNILLIGGKVWRWGPEVWRARSNDRYDNCADNGRPSNSSSSCWSTRLATTAKRERPGHPRSLPLRRRSATR
jgi:hypothetical protein